MIRSLFGELRSKVAGKGIKIVFPEGNDERVVRAAARLKFEGLVDPIILGEADQVKNLLKQFGFADQNYTIINPNTYPDFDKMKELFLEIRKGKATPEVAETVAGCQLFRCHVSQDGVGRWDGFRCHSFNSRHGATCPANHQDQTRYLSDLRCLPNEP